MGVMLTIQCEDPSGLIASRVEAETHAKFHIGQSFTQGPHVKRAVSNQKVPWIPLDKASNTDIHKGRCRGRFFGLAALCRSLVLHGVVAGQPKQCP